MIIGMHRSGTSMLSRTLRKCGVFVGADVQSDCESSLFLSINDALFTRCYSIWNNPFGIHLALQNQQAVDDLARCVLEGQK